MRFWLTWTFRAALGLGPDGFYFISAPVIRRVVDGFRVGIERLGGWDIRRIGLGSGLGS